MSLSDAAHLKPGSRIVRYGFIQEKKDKEKQKHQRSNSTGHKKINLNQKKNNNPPHHRNSSDGGPGAPVKTKNTLTRTGTANKSTIKKPVKSSGYGK